MNPDKYNETVSLFSEFTEDQISDAIIGLQEYQMMFEYKRGIEEAGRNIEANIPKVQEITHKLKLNFHELSDLLGYLNKTICRHLEYTHGEVVNEEDEFWYKSSTDLEKKLENYNPDTEFTQDEADYVRAWLDHWDKKEVEKTVKAATGNDDWLDK